MAEDYYAALTEAERQAIEEPALKQRAMALVAATEFATRVGMDESRQDALYESIRQLDKTYAKAARKNFEASTKLLATLGIKKPEVADATAPEEPAAAPAEDSVQSLNFERTQKFLRLIDASANKSWFDVPETPDQLDEELVDDLIALRAVNYPGPASRVENWVNKAYGLLGDGVEGQRSYTDRSRFAKDIARLLNDLGSAPKSEELAEKQPDVVELKESSEAAVEQLIIEHEDMPAELRLDRVEVFLKQLRDKGMPLKKITAADITHGMLERMAQLYGQYAKADPDVVRTNSMCTWGYLAGIEMADLVMWRAKTKPNAVPQDVHNSRTMFVSSLSRAWRLSLASGESPEEFVLGPSEDLIEEEPEEIEEPTLTLVPTESPVVAEARSFDEEPRHVRIAHEFTERLGLTVNQRAFEEFLNPKNKGELTATKIEIVQAIQRKIEAAGLDVLDTLEISSRSKAALRRIFATGFMKHGRDVARAPEQLRNVVGFPPNVHTERYTEEIYDALEALLDALAPEEQAAPAFQRVVFDGGVPRLV